MNGCLADEAEARAFVTSLPAVDAPALARLEQLCALLAEENARQNLVSAASLAEVWRRHIADSAQLQLHELDDREVADLEVSEHELPLARQREGSSPPRPQCSLERSRQ